MSRGRAAGVRVGEERLVAVIGDEDTVTGFLLAGVGDVDRRRGRANFLIVTPDTPLGTIEDKFKEFVSRSDISVIADEIRYVLADYTAAIPAVLEVPSKDHPYDTSKDFVLARCRALFGGS